MELWFSSRNDAKAIAKINPRYLARSPVNILIATKFMGRSPYPAAERLARDEASRHSMKGVCSECKDLLDCSLGLVRSATRQRRIVVSSMTRNTARLHNPKVIPRRELTSGVVC